jgi:hypothetical protein
LRKDLERAQKAKQTANLERERKAAKLPPHGVLAAAAAVLEDAGSCPVELRGETERPRVRGQEVKKLSYARYKVIEALVRVWPKSLRKDALIEASVASAVDAFKGLARLSPWDTVLIAPGSDGRGTGYRIRPR